MPQYLMGLDIGGGGGRCLVVNIATRETFNVFRSWSLDLDAEVGGFAYRMDPDNLWKILCETTQAALVQGGIQAGEVVGIAAASMRHSTVALDHRGHVLLFAPNRDARAAAQGMQLAADRGEELYHITGHTPSPIFMAARLLWLKENDPPAFRSASAVMSISDWIGYRLTGEKASEYAQAGESLLLDLKTRKWSAAILKWLGVPEKMLPPLKPAGSKLGKLTREAAANLGLNPGIPVAVGGPDTQCGLLGLGAVASGQVGVIAGTTTPVQMVVDKLIVDPEMRIWTGLHVIPGLYVLESNAGQMGSTLEWVARLLYGQVPNPVARLAAEAVTSIPGAYGIHSTIGAAVFNSSALAPPVDNLTFSSIIARLGDEGRADVARAVLEGMAYAVRANLEQITQVTGEKPGEVCLGGGITRSHLWTKIIADLLSCRIRVAASSEATALGAAICAGVAAGSFPSLTAGARALAHPDREHLPDPQLESTYQALYADWQSLRQERLSADMVAAAQITQTMLSGTLAGRDGPMSNAFRPQIYIAAEVDELALKQLGEVGEVTYKPYRTEGILLTGDDLVNTLQGYQVFVTEVDILDAACLLKLPELRLVVVCRGNPVNVDIEACTAAGVAVTNTPARNADAVADLTLGFVLMLARRLQTAAAFLRQPGGEAGDLGRMGQAHEEFLGVELWRKTIGLVGGGAIGRKVAARLLPFGARVLLYDPFVSAEGAALMGVEKVSFERLLAESDFISLHAAVTDETRGMLNAAAFERMKPGAFVVNTARAALIDHEALLSALHSGKLGGLATDVFPVEPPGADDPLLALPNVLATPHMGGNTREVAAHQGEIILTELQLLLAGQRPKYILNPAALASFNWQGARRMDEARLQARAAGPGPGATDLDVAAQKESASDIKPEQLPAAVSQPAAWNGKEQGVDNANTRQKVMDILQEFTASIAVDPDMASFAKGKNVVFLFTLKDLDQSFFLSFIEGRVGAGLGHPPRDPDVKLKMAADILDGMFTGRINATRAATSGKLSFSGDTGKAMAFMRIQGNMSRLYRDARAKVGDPGDLTQLGAAAPAAVASSLPAAPAPAGGSAAVQAAVIPAAERVTGLSVTRTGDVRDQILQVADEMYAKGLITATGGNISARCEDNPNEIWITPSGIFKGDLRSDMMVRIDLTGRIIHETDYTASSERRVHCEIFRNMPEIQAVIHTHAPYATLMALTGTHFQPVSADAAFFGDIPVVPFIMPGTDELGQEVAKAMLQNGLGVLMQNHGLVVAGSSLRRAADMSEIIEGTAHKLIHCRLLGVKPALLPEDVVRELKEIGKSIA